MKLPKLRWSLRTFLIVVVLAGAVLGTVGRRVFNQRRVASTVRTLTSASGGTWELYYDYQVDAGQHDQTKDSPIPDWLLSLFGQDVFHDIVSVSLDGGRCTLSDLTELQALPKLIGLDVEYCQVTPGFLETLPTLSNLERLDLQETGIRSQDLSNLAKLGKLKTLLMSGKQIDDEAVELLCKLKSLKVLTIRRCSISFDGRQAIRDALPHCTVTITEKKSEFSVN